MLIQKNLSKVVNLTSLCNNISYHSSSWTIGCLIPWNNIKYQTMKSLICYNQFSSLFRCASCWLLWQHFTLTVHKFITLFMTSKSHKVLDTINSRTIASKMHCKAPKPGSCWSIKIWLPFSSSFFGQASLKLPDFPMTVFTWNSTEQCTMHCSFTTLKIHKMLETTHSASMANFLMPFSLFVCKSTYQWRLLNYKYSPCAWDLLLPIVLLWVNAYG